MRNFHAALKYFHSSGKGEVITEIYVQVRDRSFLGGNINWGEASKFALKGPKVAKR